MKEGTSTYTTTLLCFFQLLLMYTVLFTFANSVGNKMRLTWFDKNFCQHSR